MLYGQGPMFDGPPGTIWYSTTFPEEVAKPYFAILDQLFKLSLPTLKSKRKKSKLIKLRRAA